MRIKQFTLHANARPSSKNKAPTTDTIGKGKGRTKLDIDMEWDAQDAQDDTLDAKMLGKGKDKDNGGRKHFVYSSKPRNPKPAGLKP